MLPTFDLIDAHCHIHPPWFEVNDIEDIIKSASLHQVNTIINCSSDPRSNQFVVESQKFPNIEISIGLQPTLADKINSASIIRDLIEQGIPLKAIGEVGLDYYWVKDKALQNRQKDLFLDCIELANENDLPLVIHSRKAELECLLLLEKHANVPVLLHSFEGNLEKIAKVKDLDYLVSIPSNVVWRKNRKKVATRMGLDNIVLETDAPFCGPTPDIKVNTPKHILTSANKLIELFKVTIEELAMITTNNAKKFYQLK